MKSLDRAYNDQMDVGTSQFALYYKDWIKLGAQSPAVPSVTLPSVAVSRSIQTDPKLQQRQSNSIQQHPFVEPAPEPPPAPPPPSTPSARRSYSLRLLPCHSNSLRLLPCRSNSLRLLSCRSNSNKDLIHPQIPKSASFNDVPVLNLERAISLISNSDSLPECETAIRLIAKSWLDFSGESVIKTILSTSSFIEGLLEISFTSKDDDVLEIAISILAELVTRSEINRQVMLNADPQLEILLRLSERSSLFLKVAVLTYLLRPKAKQMLSSDWIPLALQVLEFGDKKETLFTLQCCPKSAAMYLLDQLITGFDVDRNLENARQIVALGGLSLLIKRLELGNEREKEICVSLLDTCIQADGSCRDYMVANIQKASLVQLFSGNQLKSDGSAISLLSELVCLNRTTRMIEFLNGLKNDGCLNTMHVLLVYLQQAPHEQRPLAAVLLLQLDLLGDSSHCSFYGEEGIDAIIVALERSLHNKKVREQCSRALLILGGHFSSVGEPLTESWLLRRAGMRDVRGDLFRSKWRTKDEFERMTNHQEEEEKSRDSWLRKLAITLLSSGYKRFVVALSNCIADGIPGLARSCLITVAWVSCSISSLHNVKSSPHALACSILRPRLLESLSYDKALEERVLASLSLHSFARHRECLQMLLPLSKETLSSLEELSSVTWTADELLFMCSLWLNPLNRTPRDLFGENTE
ncbi:putative E3 ubiquitin-protein ligase LIN-1 isoform X2 [Asparagus officinalis]|uniref:putative E3 ubiquitin-protein ligase LIN-1 isoform X2 n=1 Tax=Asparagus officinalis TaxID=4686 RepID=UPI00098E67E2|nr:putative E3 ubiquitin-protein ligase LIN-1 isoform X2 [Asparagus officinalis]